MKVTDNPYLRSATGLEVKDWIWYNANHDTKYTKIASRLMNKFNLSDEKFYMIVHCVDKTRIIEVPERGEKYQIPCDDQIGD